MSSQGKGNIIRRRILLNPFGKRLVGKKPGLLGKGGKDLRRKRRGKRSSQITAREIIEWRSEREKKLS